MSAWRLHAMSQVGGRLMVASSAKISRPFAPGACGDRARALATKAAMSSAVDVFACGNVPDFSALAETASPLPGLVGSPDIPVHTSGHAANVDTAARPVNPRQALASVGLGQQPLADRCAKPPRRKRSGGLMRRKFVGERRQPLAGAIRATGPGSSTLGGDEIVSTGATSLSVALRNLS